MIDQAVKTIACCTLGCKVNTYESQAIMESFERKGFRIGSFEDQADVYIINTCTVTQIAARKSRQMIHRARKRNPEALIVACGCYVDQNKDQETLSDLVDLAISNKDKDQLVQTVEAMIQVREPAAQVEEPLFITGSGDHTRAFLKVQDGCRQFCSYCIIPYVRGPLRSKPLAQAVAEAAGLVQNGCKEIVLTGIHLSSYGRDLEETVDLGDLIRELGQMSGLERIRLGSLEVGLITDEFIEKVRNVKTLCPHYHLSLQSGCDKTLKAMNRKYNACQFEAAVERLRAAFPDVSVTTDVICGFSGETEEDFMESYEFVDRIGFTDVHVFPYSVREGTVAAKRKDQVDPSIRKERSTRMAAMTDKNAVSFLERFAEKHRFDQVLVLIEDYNEKGEHWEGYTTNYLKVHIPDPEKKLMENTIVPVTELKVQHRENEQFLVGVTDGR